MSIYMNYSISNVQTHILNYYDDFSGKLIFEETYAKIRIMLDNSAEGYRWTESIGNRDLVSIMNIDFCINLYYNYTFEKKCLFLGLKRKGMKFWLNMLQPLLLRPLHLTHGAHWGSLNFSQFGT